MVSFFITLFFGLVLFSIGFSVLKYNDNELVTFGKVMFGFGAGVTITSVVFVILCIMNIIK